MMKFTRKAKGHFVTIIEVGMDLTRHDSIRSQEFLSMQRITVCLMTESLEIKFAA